MSYGLLTNMTVEALLLCLEYLICLVIIVAALLGMAVFKRRTKKQMRAETVKKSCEKAKAAAEEMLDDGKNKGAYVLLAASKLAHLSLLVADAAWYAFQIVGAKKNILYEGIANSLDEVATELSNASEEGYISVKDYQACLEKTMQTLDAVMAKLDSMA